MKQVTQDLKKGEMKILEVPFPALAKGWVLVRSRYSVISAGTEGKTVRDARKGYLAKAKARKKEVMQVIEQIKRSGLRETYRLVMNKLEAPSPLGYSCCGEVIAVGEGVADVQVGDRVACGGSTAVHADVVAVPRNLCVRVPAGVELKHAAFTAIAAIAIQGVRQAEVRLGEKAAVIGLGLVGQLTAQLLQAAGVGVVGIDIDDRQVASAQAMGIDQALNRNCQDLEQVVAEWSGGHGVDAVIITASTTSTDPVDLAGKLCRPRGKVVVVGVVPTGFDRAPYYKKELDLRLSCSYGPGRYDPGYEEKGIDYPIGWVRWTENRNMQAFLDLLAKGKLNIAALVSHEMELEAAPVAYRMILARSEPFSGILIRYDEAGDIQKTVILRDRQYEPAEVRVGLIGAGNFAQNVLLPILKNRCQLVGVATARGFRSRYAADKYGFAYCSDDAHQVIADENINTLFIATRHHLHAGYVIEALEKGKHVFVEKPLAMNRQELEEIAAVYRSAAALQPPPRLMVGFNRRFAPHVRRIKELFPHDLPKAIVCRINAGRLAEDHWINDPQVGGGRIVGEVCHFVDLVTYLSGGKVENVYARDMRDARGLQDTLVISLGFDNGSVASIAYFSNGSKNLAKEHLEVFCGGQAAVIDDFKSMTLYGRRLKRSRLRRQDKGHEQELIGFLDAIKSGSPSPIPFEELYRSSLATLKVIESIRQGQVAAC
jgi:predicted dehydrogenase